jgi:hypothetical protein
MTWLSEGHDPGRKSATSEGNNIGRPRKNRQLLIGRAGRNAIEQEDIARDSLRWERRKLTIAKHRRD